MKDKLLPGSLIYLQTDVFEKSEEMNELFKAPTSGFEEVAIENQEESLLEGIPTDREVNVKKKNGEIWKNIFRRKKF